MFEVPQLPRRIHIVRAIQQASEAWFPDEYGTLSHKWEELVELKRRCGASDDNKSEYMIKGKELSERLYFMNSASWRILLGHLRVNDLTAYMFGFSLHSGDALTELRSSFWVGSWDDLEELGRKPIYLKQVDFYDLANNPSKYHQGHPENSSINIEFEKPNIDKGGRSTDAIIHKNVLIAACHLLYNDKADPTSPSFLKDTLERANFLGLRVPQAKVTTKKILDELLSILLRDPAE